jgi:hypothetical protein
MGVSEGSIEGTGNSAANFAKTAGFGRAPFEKQEGHQGIANESPTRRSREFFAPSGEFASGSCFLKTV